MTVLPVLILLVGAYVLSRGKSSTKQNIDYSMTIFIPLVFACALTAWPHYFVSLLVPIVFLSVTGFSTQNQKNIFFYCR